MMSSGPQRYYTQMKAGILRYNLSINTHINNATDYPQIMNFLMSMQVLCENNQFSSKIMRKYKKIYVTYGLILIIKPPFCAFDLLLPFASLMSANFNKSSKRPFEGSPDASEPAPSRSRVKSSLTFTHVG